MIQQSFGSNYSEVLDREILKNVNRQLKKIFIFFAIDIFFCLFCATIDTIFYLYDFIPKMFLEFFFYSNYSNNSHSFSSFAQKNLLHNSRSFLCYSRRIRLVRKDDIFMLFSFWWQSKRLF